jgi:hypothetical protein
MGKESFIECPICLEEYGEETKVPLLLPCGHTLCNSCISTITPSFGSILCPICRAVFPESQRNELCKNFALLEVLRIYRTKTVNSPPSCNLHNEHFKLFCKDCTVAICWMCKEYGEHKGHNAELIANIAKDMRIAISKKIDQLGNKQERLEEFSLQLKNGFVSLDKTEEEAKNLISSWFEAIQQQIQGLKVQALQEISKVEVL